MSIPLILLWFSMRTEILASSYRSASAYVLKTPVQTIVRGILSQLMFLLYTLRFCVIMLKSFLRLCLTSMKRKLSLDWIFSMLIH